MSIITGGNIIKGGKVSEGTITRPYAVSGVPSGSTLAGTVAVGDIVIDSLTGRLYEYTNPGGSTPTFTRIDTV